MNDAVPSAASRWRVTLIASLALFIVLLLLFRSTAQSMVHIWYHFETYTHGFVILPISLWLVWHNRKHLAGYTPQPSAGFLVVVVAGLLVWVLARLTAVLVVEQLAFVTILVGGLASILGWQVARYLAFPLLFLFFAVPMGEDLIPPMMEFTATFTVEAVRLSGVPVYREGLWFSLPSGNWSVVEACSGVRYLIASITLGFVYAYITYHTLWKRVLFVVMSAVVPILANGLRAYMIVMIGHLSKMEYATGVDHLIYGWVFFGVVMFILFWLGSFWQEEQAPAEFVAPPRTMALQSVRSRLLIVSSTALLLSAATVWWTQQLESIEIQTAGLLEAPATPGEWSLSNQPVLWPMAHQPTVHKVEARYERKGDEDVQLFVALFPRQGQGGEAINQQNSIASDLVRLTALGSRDVTLGESQVTIKQAKVLVTVDGSRHEHLMWQWYRVAGRNLSNRYAGKAWEALSRIYPGRADGAWVAITTPIEGEKLQSAEERLASFARSMTPQLDAAADAVLGLAN